MNLLEANLIPLKTILKSETGLEFLFIGVDEGSDDYPIRAVAIRDSRDSGVSFDIGEGVGFTRSGRYEESSPTTEADIVSFSKPYIPKAGDRVYLFGAAYRDGNIGKWFCGEMAIVRSLTSHGGNDRNSHLKVFVDGYEWWIHLRNITKVKL